MRFTGLFFLSLISTLSGNLINAQYPDSIRRVEGYVYNESDIPLAWTHIINLSSGRGTTSNSEGHFSLTANEEDSILFRNLAYEELILSAGNILRRDTIRLKIKLYAIKEVKIFEWGSTYEDFMAKMMSMPVTESIAQKLGLPQQTGNPVPNYQNPAVLGNPMFAITNPIDFLYYNLNKNQQSIRKVNEFKQNEDLIRRFEAVYNRTAIGNLTSLNEKGLDDFMIYLNLHFKCDFNCTEVQIISEIFKCWREYKLTKNDKP
jgi:hypothetical protein